MQPPRSQRAGQLWRLSAQLFGLGALFAFVRSIFSIDAAWFRYGIGVPLSIIWLAAFGAFLVVRCREIRQFRREHPPSDSATTASRSA